MFDYAAKALPGVRLKNGWFVRARIVMALAIGAMLALAAGGGIAVATGRMGGAMSAWYGFSLLPLAGLVVLQMTARVQESLTMRYGGRPIAVENR